MGRSWARLFQAASLVLLLPALAWAQTSKFPANSQLTNLGYASVAVTYSDTVKIAVTRAIYIGNATACNLSLQLNGDTAPLTWSNIQPGTYLQVQAVLIRSTNSTCTAANVLAIY